MDPDKKTAQQISKIKKRWQNIMVLEHNLHLPKHIFFIADGNSRWAKKYKLPFLTGYLAGIETALSITRTCFNWGIPVVSVWGFSTENWQRTLKEVLGIFKIFETYFSNPKIISELVEKGVRIKHIGRRDRLAKIRPSLLKTIENLEKVTSKNKKHILFLAIDYGGQDEIVRVMQKIGNKILSGHLEPDKINHATISAALDTSGYPDPDFIIRTSGEIRLSGAVSFQGAYAELYFEPMFFPDLTPRRLRKAIESFSKRKRKFGARGVPTDGIVEA